MWLFISQDISSLNTVGNIRQLRNFPLSLELAQLLIFHGFFHWHQIYLHHDSITASIVHHNNSLFNVLRNISILQYSKYSHLFISSVEVVSLESSLIKHDCLLHSKFGTLLTDPRFHLKSQGFFFHQNCLCRLWKIKVVSGVYYMEHKCTPVMINIENQGFTLTRTSILKCSQHVTVEKFFISQTFFNITQSF